MRGAGFMPSYYTIHQHVVEQIKEYCYKKYPDEGYGFLAGHLTTITHFFPVPSQNRTPCSLEPEPSAYFDIIKQIRSNQLEWLGVMRSHPLTQAYPSNRDLSAWSFANKSLWIMSLKDKQMQFCAYYIHDRKAIPLMFKIIE